MSTTAGVFSETDRQNIRIMAEKLMMDDRIKQQFMPNTGTWDAIKRVQTANVKPYVTSGKDDTFELEWINTCGLTAEDNTSCTIGGTEASTNTETKTLTNSKVVNFSVYEKDFKTNDFSGTEVLTKLFLGADKTLVEWFQQYAIGIINANKGVNEYTGGKGEVSGADTYLLASYWNPELFAYLDRVSVRNKFTAPILLDQGNLYEQSKIAQWKAANANGKGDAAMFGSLPYYPDLFNLDTVNGTSDIFTYMLSTGSLAMATNSHNPDTIDKRMSQWRWTMPSSFMPGVKYDVFYEDSCDTAGNDDLILKFKMKLTADLWVNPAGCTATNTGILTFICGSAS